MHFRPRLMKQLVLKNQLIPGSVNTGTRHFAMAVDDLESAYNKWDGLVDEIITTRIPYTRSWKRLTDDQLTISSRLWSDAGRAEHFGPVGYFRPSLKGSSWTPNANDGIFLYGTHFGYTFC